MGRKDALALQRRREQSKIISHCVQRLPPTQLPHKLLLYSHVDENIDANANTQMHGNEHTKHGRCTVSHTPTAGSLTCLDADMQNTDDLMLMLPLSVS